MLKKLFLIVLIFILLTGCISTSTVDSSGPKPVPVQTPPVFQEEVDGLSIYYLYEPIDISQMAIVPTFGGIALADGIIPGPADMVGLIVVGGVIIAYVVGRVPIEIYYDGIQDLNGTISYLAQYIPVTQDHDTNHTVVAGSSTIATTIFTELLNKWPPKDNNTRCFILKKGPEILRYLVWSFTNLSSTGIPRGNLSWWQYGPEGPEAYSYQGKSLRTMKTLPKDLEGQGYDIEDIDCNSISPPFNLLYR